MWIIIRSLRTQGWTNIRDPYGWFQGYGRYFLGRTTNDDEKQIKSWNNFNLRF